MKPIVQIACGLALADTGRLLNLPVREQDGDCTVCRWIYRRDLDSSAGSCAAARQAALDGFHSDGLAGDGPPEAICRPRKSTKNIGFVISGAGSGIQWISSGISAHGNGTGNMGFGFFAVENGSRQFLAHISGRGSEEKRFCSAIPGVWNGRLEVPFGVPDLRNARKKTPGAIPVVGNLETDILFAIPTRGNGSGNRTFPIGSAQATLIEMKNALFLTAILTCLLLALHAHAKNDSPDSELTWKPATGQWKFAPGEFKLDPSQWSLKAELEREVFHGSEEMLLTVILTNKTDSPLSLMEWLFAKIDYYVRVFDAAGKEVPMTEEGRRTLNPSLISGKYLPRVIGPKRSRIVQINISKLFELRDGQKYTVKAARFVDDGRENKTDPVAVEFRTR